MRIEEILKEKGLSKADFALKMGTSRQNVNSLLKNPSAKKIEEMSQALNVPLWQLFASPEEVQHNKQGDDVCAFVRFRSHNNKDVHLHADTWAEFWAMVDEIADTHPRPRKQP